MIYFARAVMAAVWLYNGLWLKLIAHDPEHVAIVTSVVGPQHAMTLLMTIGAAETLLAIGIASGIAYKAVNSIQLGALVAMNAVGILFGGVTHPVGLIVQNLPLACCALFVIFYGHARRP